MLKLTEEFFKEVFRLSHLREDSIGGLIGGIILCRPTNLDELYACIIIRLENYQRDNLLRTKNGTDVTSANDFVELIKKEIDEKTIAKLNSLGIPNIEKNLKLVCSIYNKKKRNLDATLTDDEKEIIQHYSNLSEDEKKEIKNRLSQNRREKCDMGKGNHSISDKIKSAFSSFLNK